MRSFICAFRCAPSLPGTPSELLPMTMGKCGFEPGAEGEMVHTLTDPSIMKPVRVAAAGTQSVLLLYTYFCILTSFTYYYFIPPPVRSQFSYAPLVVACVSYGHVIFVCSSYLVLRYARAYLITFSIPFSIPFCIP